MDLLECEWGSCEEKFPLSSFQDFREHFEGHLRGIFPGYRAGFSDDNIPENFTCFWRDCGWDSPIDAGDIIRHVFFHAFHTKIKLEGYKKQQEMKLTPCTLDSQSRNLLPDIPEPFLCEWKECSVEFNCPTLYYRHVDSHAWAVDKIYAGVGENGRKKYSVTCQWEGCNFTTVNHYKLKEHCRSHTREKIFACVTCGGMFANKTKLVDHMVRQNSSGFESFQCSHCLKHCGSERILRDHMRHHVNNVKCQFCDMTCPNASALKQHVKFRHSEERPFKCDVCSYTCKMQSDLRRHREFHNAVLAYHCDFEGCTFSARAMQTVKRHQKVDHQGIDLYRYECHVCGQRYTRGSGLTNHLKKKHRFSWPAGHPRFRYKECDDGICRLQTVRFESLHLSQLMNEQEGAGNTEMQAGDSPQDCIDSPATSGGSPESNIEGSPFLNRGDHPGELNYQELLQEWNESNSSTQDRRHNGGGPIRSHVMGRVSEAHPYERSESPELDLPQTLLDLQDAAIRLANGQN